MICAPDIERFWVANWPKTSPDSAQPPTEFRRPQFCGLTLDTCLRQMCLSTSEPDHSWASHAFFLPTGATYLTGTDAYRFSLEVVTGLRSAVPGETNVFGQFRNAWSEYRRNEPSARIAGLAPIIHQLINDCRNIRRTHLQGIGGASYGSLVRRLIAPKPGERILFVGAGDLARSMLPFFENFEVGIWNHRFFDKREVSADVFFAPRFARASARWADHVIFYHPP